MNLVRRRRGGARIPPLGNVYSSVHRSGLSPFAPRSEFCLVALQLTLFFSVHCHFAEPLEFLGFIYQAAVPVQSVFWCTGRPDKMLHRKWRETKQQPSRARSGHQISCCLVSLHFLCDILSGRPVDISKFLAGRAL